MKTQFVITEARIREISIISIPNKPYSSFKYISDYELRVVQIQANSFLRSISEKDGSDIERL